MKCKTCKIKLSAKERWVTVNEEITHVEYYACDKCGRTYNIDGTPREPHSELTNEEDLALWALKNQVKE